MATQTVTINQAKKLSPAGAGVSPVSFESLAHVGEAWESPGAAAFDFRSKSLHLRACVEGIYLHVENR